MAITPEVFHSLLSREDLEDIKAGDIPVKTVEAFEATAVAKGSRRPQGDTASAVIATVRLRAELRRRLC